MHTATELAQMTINARKKVVEDAASVLIEQKFKKALDNLTLTQIENGFVTVEITHDELAAYAAKFNEITKSFPGFYFVSMVTYFEVGPHKHVVQISWADPGLFYRNTDNYKYSEEGRKASDREWKATKYRVEYRSLLKRVLSWFSKK